MSADRPVTFRPSIVLFMGDCGERIYNHLQRLCAGLDEPLREGVAILQLDARGQQARRLPIVTHGVGASSYETQYAPLAQVFAATLTEVQGKLVNERITRDGYVIENPKTQIFIAGHTTSSVAASDPLAEVARVVRDQIRAEDFATQVYYVLSDYRDYDQSSPLKQASLPAWALNLRAQEAPSASGLGIGGDALGYDLPAVTFCFLYQKKSQQQQLFYSPDVVEFAAAETLFGMIATSASAAAGLVEALYASPRVIDITERIGSMGTCLIRFPRAEAIEYCADLLGVELLRNWSHGMRSSITEEQRRTQQAAAKRLEDSVRAWLHAALAPNTQANPREWPHPAQLAPATRDLLHRYHDATTKLFEPLRPRAVSSVARTQSDDDKESAWSKAVRICEGRARDYLPQWEESARRGWGQAEQEIDGHLTQVVDDLWLRDRGSWEEAREYVNALSDRLVETKEELVKWRREHDKRYRAELRRFQALARPVPGDDGRIIAGGEDEPAGGIVRPTAEGTDMGTGGVPPLPSSTRTGGPTITQPAGAQKIPSPKDPREEEQRLIRRGISRRITYMERRVPSVSSLVAATVMAVAPLSLLALDILPRAWGAKPVVVAAVIGVVGALLAISGWLYRRWRMKLVHDVEQALVESTRSYYRYRRNRHEDNLRAELVMSLHWRVQLMRDQLRDWPRQLATLADELEREALKTEHDLFKGPSGALDILIGNGERLVDSLAPLHSEVRKQRASNPRASWHVTPEQMNARLREIFRQISGGVIGARPEALNERIRTFTRDVVAPYLSGPIANISAALRSPDNHGADIWRDALRRATPLYLGHGADVQTLVCGRVEDLRAVARMPLNRETALIHTKECERNREWLLVSKFTQGGVLTNWSRRATHSRVQSDPFDPNTSTTWDQPLSAESDGVGDAETETETANNGSAWAPDPGVADRSTGPDTPPGYGEALYERATSPDDGDTATSPPGRAESPDEDFSPLRPFIPGLPAPLGPSFPYPDGTLEGALDGDPLFPPGPPAWIPERDVDVDERAPTNDPDEPVL